MTSTIPRELGNILVRRVSAVLMGLALAIFMLGNRMGNKLVNCITIGISTFLGSLGMSGVLGPPSACQIQNHIWHIIAAISHMSGAKRGNPL